MSYQFRPAQRSEAKPLIGLYSESGCGKTWSSLLLARGFVGPSGRIGMLETESGRGEIYVGVEPVGDYLVCPLRTDFSPAEFGKAITAAEGASLDALIIDSASHEWEGVNGVLSQAADNQAAGKKGPIVWQKPKMEHARHFVLRLMQTPIPLVIVNMRAKYPMREVPKQGGGKEWVRSDQLDPKQSEDILFEMMCHGWIDKQHALHVTKYPQAVPAWKDIIQDGKPLSVETGQRLKAWATGQTIATPTTGTTNGADTITVEEATALEAKCTENNISVDKLKEKAGVARLALIKRADLAKANAWIDGVLKARKEKATA
jgi:hypothetical protein